MYIPGAIDFKTIPVAFYFKVHFIFDGVVSGEPVAVSATAFSAAVDASFSEVSGLGWKAGTEDVSEGGRMEKRTVYTGVEYDDLVLRRGIVPIGSPLTIWCEMVKYLKGGSIVPATVIVNLLDANGAPSRSWVFNRAYPVAWSIDNFNSMENKLAIESISLKHAGCTRML